MTAHDGPSGGEDHSGNVIRSAAALRPGVELGAFAGDVVQGFGQGADLAKPLLVLCLCHSVSSVGLNVVE